MRLFKDILISAVFAVCSAFIGLMVGFVLVPVVVAVFFPKPAEDATTFFASVMLVLLPGLFGLIFGVFGFPLCGIWLDERRKKRALLQS